MNPPSSHTHCQVAQADTQAKTCQRVCLPPTHGRQKRCSKLKGKLIENNEHQPITSGIKHWGLSGYASVLPRIKFGVTGQDSSPQSPTISYRQPLPTRQGEHSTKINIV
jgi:hypothetical protein